MKYMKLDQKGNAMAEYIWIDSNGGVRSKSRVRNFFAFLIFAPNWLGSCYLIPSCHLQSSAQSYLGPLQQAHVQASSIYPTRKWPSVRWHATGMRGLQGLVCRVALVSSSWYPCPLEGGLGASVRPHYSIPTAPRLPTSRPWRRLYTMRPPDSFLPCTFSRRLVMSSAGRMFPTPA